MKDYIVIIILLFLFLFRSSDIEAQAFQARNVNFDLGYIFGSRAVYANFISPGAIISLQKGVYKWISVGAYAGVQQHLLGAPVTSTNNLDYTAVYAGVNGSFHFYQML